MGHSNTVFFSLKKVSEIKEAKGTLNAELWYAFHLIKCSMMFKGSLASTADDFIATLRKLKLELCS